MEKWSGSFKLNLWLDINVSLKMKLEGSKQAFVGVRKPRWANNEIRQLLMRIHEF